jgi:hypothetical protein
MNDSFVQNWDSATQRSRNLFKIAHPTRRPLRQIFGHAFGMALPYLRGDSRLSVRVCHGEFGF